MDTHQMMVRIAGLVRTTSMVKGVDMNVIVQVLKCKFYEKNHLLLLSQNMQLFL